MSSFSIPLSGLEAATTDLDTIANNLANMNTTAYKSQDVSFSDLFYQQIGSTGSGDPLEVGTGVQVETTATDYTEGGVDTTGVGSDVMLNGNGFFVVQGSGGTEYTRDGSFTQSASGTLITQNGLEVMGYQAVNGAVGSNSTLGAIQLPVQGQVEQPSATTTMSVTANLDASAAVGATYSSPITIYDSLGDSHAASITYTKTGTNTWSYSVSVADTVTPSTSTTGGVDTNTYNFGAGATVDPSTNLTITAATTSGGTATIAAPTVTSGESLATYTAALNSALTAAGITGVTATQTGNTVSISGASFSTTGTVTQDAAGTNNTGTLTFDASGNLSSPSNSVEGIQFSGLADGAAPLNLTWNLAGSNGTSPVTQVAGTSATTNTVQNGYPSGTYEGFTVSSNGTISAAYSNNQTQVVGQLALANVTNPEGLSVVAGNDYETTLASGAASISTAGSDGLGTIEDGALEASNVNISTEFSDLIVAQQSYEASSKAITTLDTISQDTINMIH
ncbi:flagellar hook protein FlgE [Silvibacterium acidisoli]|uniref:flagellar hook protein FlgE n=1 Tax=Acidobacteriaceae bacterium ZG23-2 TaxID=2883246 RepID=UPI00406BF5C3